MDVPQQIAEDNQDFVHNLLRLMESSLDYLLRNIHVGISAEQGGTAVPQYPEEVLRETVNNALAHREFSMDKQVVSIPERSSNTPCRKSGACCAD